jgi:hypothetical protein
MKIVVLIAALAAAVTGLSCNRDNSPSESSPAATTPAPTPTPTPDPGGGGVSAPGTKQTRIYFTKNHNKGTGSPYNTDCIGIVGTERIGAKTGKPATTSPPKPAEPGTKIIWHIKVNNGENDDDKCDNLNMADVNLRFVTDVMGAAQMKKLTATGATIQGEVTSDPMDVGAVIDHKYWVYIGNEKAGPDPIIVINCGSCGPPPTQ